MIPKIIHYCWFGNNELSGIAKKCLKSWSEVLPDYEIKLWNEKNFNIECNQYVKEAYKSRKYAFVTDYVRLYALYYYGGIYMDTDVEVLQPLDAFLYNEAFSGFEKKDSVPTGIMASRKGNSCIYELLNYYENRSFIMQDGTYDLTTNVKIITDILLKYELRLDGTDQTVNGFHLYPQIYFCSNTIAQVLNIKPHNKNIYTFHHCGEGWGGNGRKEQKFGFRMKRYITGKLRNLIGTRNLVNIRQKMIKNLKR